jgi:hypothetical protein
MGEGRSGHRQLLRDPRADELRRRFHALYTSEEIPVPVEAIAEDLPGLIVEEDQELPVSGMLLPAERRIWLNAREARESPGRHRFTLAHELAHWVCQCLEGRGAPVMCRAQDIGAGADRTLEREANAFAAELLMPELAVREAWRNWGTWAPARLRSTSRRPRCGLSRSFGSAVALRTVALRTSSTSVDGFGVSTKRLCVPPAIFSTHGSSSAGGLPTEETRRAET